jgi:membrane-bound lytic murein transglycosylase MltF
VNAPGLRLCALRVRTWAVLPALLISAVAAGQEKREAPHHIPLSNTAWKGDLDAMLERRVIRVLVPYSRTLFFSDRGHERGITADLVRELERFLNTKHGARLGKRPVTVVLVPTTRDKLLSGIEEGLGDIAAGNLTITDARRERVDFVPLTGLSTVKEVVVAGPAAPAPERLEDLSGHTVHVRTSSSYAESLDALNGRLKAGGRAPVQVTPLPEALEDEDVLEMLNAGILELTVVDDWMARIWAKVLPKLRVRTDLSLRDEGKIGWAIRKGSPQLAAELAGFFTVTSRNWGGFDSRVASFEKRIKQITNNTRSQDVRRFDQTIGLFDKYGERYGFDPLLLTAQGFQESKLRQEVRSPAGAIGVMQVLPSTATDLKVGDISQLEPNIHAGTKYMSQLMTRYFPDASFDAVNRPLFAFASYNAGPGAIARLRREAERRGLDPDRWFNNVEIVVAAKIGIETTTYVRNIYKYYVAYRLLLSARDAQRAAREKALPSGGGTSQDR